jgi:hypothetical protein
MVKEMGRSAEDSEHTGQLWDAPVEYIVILTERFLSFSTVSERKGETKNRKASGVSHFTISGV